MPPERKSALKAVPALSTTLVTMEVRDTNKVCKVDLNTTASIVWVRVEAFAINEAEGIPSENQSNFVPESRWLTGVVSFTYINSR